MLIVAIKTKKFANLNLLFSKWFIQLFCTVKIMWMIYEIIKKHKHKVSYHPNLSIFIFINLNARRFPSSTPLVIEGFQPETILALFKPTTLVQLGLLHPTWVDMNKANTLFKPVKRGLHTKQIAAELPGHCRGILVRSFHTTNEIPGE